MKKTLLVCYLFIFCSFCFSEEQIFFNYENKIINLENSISTITLIIGEPTSIEVQSFKANPDWDTLLYKYDKVVIYKYRKPMGIFGFLIFDTSIPVTIQKTQISVGMKITEVESVIGDGSRIDLSDNEFTVIYQFENWIEVQITYKNKENPFVSSILVWYPPL